MNQAHRASIFVEDAEILDHQGFPGDQFIIRLKAPKCAQKARPGSFVHIQCDPHLAMRRPLSIMRVSPQGWIDLLYKSVGTGTAELSQKQAGQNLSLMGPIGKPFRLSQEFSRPLLLGGGVGIPPMVFLAEQLSHQKEHYNPLVLMGSEVPFPFQARPSQLLVPGVPEGVIASMPLLDDWGVANRLASQQEFAGCYHGFITDLARHWLQQLEPRALQQVEMFACGPHPMLAAVAKLANEFGRPCQVSLEEFMACAVGGCAGCVVEVTNEQGSAMKRVCVDGPVFDARQVFPQ